MTLPTALSVNLNRVALLRNSRDVGIPSVTRIARLVLAAGAQGLTVHPRPDERHIRAVDVAELAALLREWPGREYNLEGNPLHNLMPFVRQVRPQQATFVPDRVDQATSDHGWDLPADIERLRPLISEAQACGARVSLFMDPIPSAMRHAKAAGADRVELHTARYARAHGGPRQAEVLASFAGAAEEAHAAGLAINAGHDLNLANLGDFLAAVPGVSEMSIGHALMAEAIEIGYPEAVRKYLDCIQRATDLAARR